MVNDDPVRLVEAGLEGEVGDPRGFFAQLAGLPIIVVIRFEPDIGAVHFFREALQQRAGDVAIEVAFVRENDFGFRKIRHGVRLNKFARRGERGIYLTAKNAESAENKMFEDA